MKAKGNKSTRPKKSPTVSKKPVQISLDPKILRRVDADEQTRTEGRSAFMLSAILLYLREKERHRIDAEVHRVYDAPGVAEELYAEMEPFLASQAWPPEDDLVEAGEAPPIRRRASSRR